MKNFFNNLSGGGKAFLILVVIAALIGIKFGYAYLFPQKAKKVEVTTKATGIPPLSYDKNANAPFRKIPEFNEPVDVQAPEQRMAQMAWCALTGVNYMVGGQSTSKGSIAEELGLNIKISNQNSCTEQGNQLYKFAEALHNGEAQPSVGVHYINWMADAYATYAAGLNERLIKDFGPEYGLSLVTFSGISFGEDKVLLKAKYAKDPAGALIVTVRLDGDWNLIKAQADLLGKQVNYDNTTYDRTKINVVDAPNNDFMEAGKAFISGVKYTLHIVENGKLTGKDTTLAASGVSSWFPIDYQVVSAKPGLVTWASTKTFATQMACGIISIKKWTVDNRPLVEKFIEGVGKGGDQVKSHDEALQFASKVNELVFADKEKTADDWYRAYKSFDVTDDDGNVVNVGGSRVFSLADAASYTGVSGGSDKYKFVYNLFGNIAKEAYPELVSSFPEYSEVTDWSFLKAVYNRNKLAGTEGSVSKVDFSQSEKGSMTGDASYAIEFNLGSAVIKPESYAVLDKVSALLVNASNTFVEIGGHTDNTGNASNNLTLSQSRANAVRDYFISKDADLGSSGKMTAKGFGSNDPLFGLDPSNSKNRRVEIKLYKVK